MSLKYEPASEPLQISRGDPATTSSSKRPQWDSGFRFSVSGFRVPDSRLRVKIRPTYNHVSAFVSASHRRGVSPPCVSSCVQPGGVKPDLAEAAEERGGGERRPRHQVAVRLVFRV